jgi:light-regulated signal transduction histidine kinase (bacteriophytochrome)
MNDATMNRALPNHGDLIKDLKFLAPDATVDLSNCDREPIHIPSAIQPHGMLIAARNSDSRIAYVSENTTQFLGLAVETVLAQTLRELLGQEAFALVLKSLEGAQYPPSNILTLTLPMGGGLRFDVLAHRMEGFICLEFETAASERSWDVLSLQMMKAIGELRAPTTVLGLCTAASRLIRELTGYDRVMVYQFDPDGHGEVVAEEKAEEMEPFLGLHYPATDIPQQARLLYVLQRIRMIVDIGYTPVPIVAGTGTSEGKPLDPLDMTYCGLRSVSPIHIEYLQNMGVGATLAISLIQRDQLWGMIICHHRTSKCPSPELRALCEILGELISSLMAAVLAGEEFSERRTKKALLEVLGTAIKPRNSIGTALAGEDRVMLELVGAEGAFVSMGGEMRLFGKVPAMQDAIHMMSALHPQLVNGMAFTDELGTLYPEFAHLAWAASGALLIQIMDQPSDGVLWFRGEFAQTVSWAGKPDASKKLSPDAMPLSPRRSFALWEEVQGGRSQPWRPSEIEAAQALQNITVRALLHRTEAKDRAY